MTRNEVAPVVLFVYKRPEHASRTINAVAANDLAGYSDLIIYSDGPKDAESARSVARVREQLRAVSGFRKVEIRERDRNWGLSRSLTSGVEDVLTEYGQAVVLEDDLEVSKYFLEYMNTALDAYRHDDAVASIHGYRYPSQVELPETYFLRGADCWGWATWSRAWNHYNPDGKYLLEQIKRRKQAREFDFDGAFPFSKMLQAQVEGRVDSWAIRWYASAFLNGMYTLYPGRSLVQNIGNDGSGEHSGSGNAYRVQLTDSPVLVSRQPAEESRIARIAFADFLRTQKPSVLSRTRRRLLRSLS